MTFEVRRYAPVEPEVRSSHPSARAAFKSIRGEPWDAARDQTDRGWYVWDVRAGTRVPKHGAPERRLIVMPDEVRPQLARMRRKMPTIERPKAQGRP